MTTQFDRPLYGFRFAEIRRGDSLQTLAARELGDAKRWADLIGYNNLVPPYLTDDPNAAAPGVLVAGGLILVPAPAPVTQTTTDPEKVFESDIELAVDGSLMTADGDFAMIAGRGNLRQALKNRIETERGDLLFHQRYGCNVRRLIGTVNGPTASLLAAQYVKSAVLADPRISRVTKATAEVIGDTINASVEAEAVAGRTVVVTASP